MSATLTKSKKKAVQTQAQVSAPVVNEKMINNETKVFTSAQWEGKVSAHQGDLVIVRLSSMPKSAKPRANRQLADGDTQGSRHILTRGNAFDCDLDELAAQIKSEYEITVRKDCIGPVFTCPATLEHPEHGHHEYDCDSVNVVVFQRNLDSELREARLRD